MTVRDLVNTERLSIQLQDMAGNEDVRKQKKQDPNTSDPKGFRREEESDQAHDLDGTASESQEANFQEKYVRLLSEFTNYQRQKEEEIKSASMYGHTNLLLKIIDLADDIDMGLFQERLHEETRNILTMFKSKIENVLATEQVKPVEIGKGSAVDPACCEVMSTIQDQENKGKVIQVVSRGYTLGDRVLRPAKVIVGI